MVRQSLMFIKLRLIELFRHDSLRVSLESYNSRRYRAFLYRSTVLYRTPYTFLYLYIKGGRLFQLELRIPKVSMVKRARSLGRTL